MNVLVLADRLPFPLTNGQNLRIFHYVKKLKDRHAFTLVSYGEPPHPVEIDGLFRDIHTLDQRPRPTPAGSRMRGLRTMLSPDDKELGTFATRRVPYNRRGIEIKLRVRLRAALRTPSPYDTARLFIKAHQFAGEVRRIRRAVVQGLAGE